MSIGRNTQNYNNSVEAPRRGFYGVYESLPTKPHKRHSRGILGHSRASNNGANKQKISQMEKAGVTNIKASYISLNKLFFTFMKTIIKTQFYTAKTPIGYFYSKSSSFICNTIN